MGLTVGVECGEVEGELEEYVLTLRNRNQVIKEVDMEDGSSVALSEL